MPRETFYNLPEKKRGKIESAAVKEFSQYAYDSASVNRIIDAAGIPKGSFYQYFDDKKDIYRYVIDRLVEKKMTHLKPLLENPLQDNFFDLLYKLYGGGLEFALSNPQLQMITSRILADRKHPVFLELMRDHMQKSDQVFHMLLQKGIERGEIRADIDLELSAHIISTLNTAFSDYYLEKKGSLEKDVYLTYVSSLIALLKQGIGNEKYRDSEEGINGI